MPKRLTFEQIEAAFDALHAAAHEMHERDIEPEIAAGCHEAALPLGCWLAEHACGAIARIEFDTTAEPCVSVPISVVMGATNELKRFSEILAPKDEAFSHGEVAGLVAQLERLFIAATEPPKEEVPGND